MRRRLGPAVVFLVAAAAVSMFSIVEAQGPAVSQNINVITGSSNQYIGDLFRQRQDEPVVGISSVNPSHIVVAYNDYRTVDFADDPIVGAASPGQGAVAKLFDFLPTTALVNVGNSGLAKTRQPTYTTFSLFGSTRIQGD